MSRIGRLFFKSLTNDGGYFLRRELFPTAGTCGILLEAFNAEAKKSLAPSGRSLPGSTQSLCDFDILYAAGSQQHDLCPLGESY